VVGEGANDIGSRRKHPAARDQDGRRSRRDGRSRVTAGGVVRARRIPGARFVELEGNDHAFFVDSEPILNATRAFLTEVWEDAALQEAAADRILTTVLFTDNVDSTSHALERGDSAWRDLLAAHHAAVRRQLVRFRGSEVDTAGRLGHRQGPCRGLRNPFRATGAA
jgi:class 3 adenylate cyclase